MSVAEAGGANDLPRVLVLLATRNGAHCVGRQLDSVLRQRDVVVQVDVRDDGSTDGTREVVQALALNEPRVALRLDHAASGSAAANFFALIRGAVIDGADYVAFCDQDDEWNLDKLMFAVAELRATGAGGYSAATLATWPDGRTRVLAQDRVVRRADHLFEGAGQGCTFVFAAAHFLRLQADVRKHSDLLFGVHYHDWALYALTRASGARWFFDKRVALTYNQHGANDTGARNSGSGVARRIALIRSGWYAAQVDAVVRLVLACWPDHEPAKEWAALASQSRDRSRRMRYVARHGRRRLIDRAILIAAAAFGYL